MGPGMEIQTFERANIFGLTRYYFRGVDTRNWETLFPSQTYKSERQRDETAKRLGDLAGCPVIPERRK